VQNASRGLPKNRASIASPVYAARDPALKSARLSTYQYAAGQVAPALISPTLSCNTMMTRFARFALVVSLFGFSTSRSFADFLVGTQFESSVLRIDEATGAELPNGVTPGSAGLANVSGVTVGPDGNIYVSSLNTGEVLFYDGDTGLPLPSPHAGGRDGLFATLGSITMPTSTAGPLRFGPDGHLYVSDFGGQSVRKFDGTTGVEITPTPASVFVGPPAGLAFSANGDIFVGDFGSASVLKVSGGVPSPFVTPASGGLMTPGSLLELGNGNLLVVDLFGDQILEYNPDGSFNRQFAQIDIDLGPSPPPGADPSDYPSDVTFDGDGNLIVSVLGPTNPSDGQTYGTLLKFDLDGGTPIQTLISNDTPFASVAWIAAVDALPGDYTSNGDLGNGDYGKWRQDFGTTVAKGAGADGNGNGIVDAADYVLWRKMMPAEEPGAGGSVPEPASALLVLIAGVAPIISRRRQRHE
jgi:outer membrane protein assembly factor BamB